MRSVLHSTAGSLSNTVPALASARRGIEPRCARIGIHCNVLLPGLTDTRFASVLVKNQAILNTALTQIPLKHVTDPSGMAEAVWYLTSVRRVIRLGFVECGWGVFCPTDLNERKAAIRAIGCLLFRLLPPVARQSNQAGRLTNSTFSLAGYSNE